MKCTKCGAEFTGKFCTNCGAPAPTNPVCPNCGEEITGNFCMKCGTPAPEADSVPVQNEQTQPAQPVQTNPVPEITPEQNEFPEPVQYNPSDNFNTNVEPNLAQPQQTSFGQQFTNGSNGGYTGQQFTNQPQNNAPSGKKSMSNGKIAAIVISVVAGLFIIFFVIVGIVACNLINAGKDIVTDIAGSIVSDVEDSTIPEWLKDMIESENNSIPVEPDDNAVGLLDDVSHCYYDYTEGGVKITGYDNQFENWQDTYTVKIPSKIDGEDVVEIEYMDIYNYSGNDDMHIKVVIPGSVKVIRTHAFAYNDDINEVVIEDGVETIEFNAFFCCEELKSVTVPKSVKTMDDCGIGLEFEDDDNQNDIIEGFTLYGAKGSTAEKYAKENNLKFAEAK